MPGRGNLFLHQVVEFGLFDRGKGGAGAAGGAPPIHKLFETRTLLFREKRVWLKVLHDDQGASFSAGSCAEIASSASPAVLPTHCRLPAIARYHVVPPSPGSGKIATLVIIVSILYERTVA
ncbi:MAG TPA: hypothetical protein VF278_18325 [Pirellulales bacterium]